MDLRDFSDARSVGPVVATVVGKVTAGLRRTDGDVLTIEDATGTIDLWVPRTVPTSGIGIDKWFEFDVVAEATSCEEIDLVERQAALTKAALTGNPEEAGAVALEFIIAIQGGARPIVANSQRRIAPPNRG